MFSAAAAAAACRCLTAGSTSASRTSSCTTRGSTPASPRTGEYYLLPPPLSNTRVRVARRTVSATVTVVSDGNLLPQGFTSFSSGGQQPEATTTTIATAAVPSTSTASPEVTETHNMEVTMGSTVKLPCRQVRCRVVPIGAQ